MYASPASPEILNDQSGTEPALEQMCWNGTTWDVASLIRDIDARKIRPTVYELDTDLIRALAGRLIGMGQDDPAKAEHRTIISVADLKRVREMAPDTLEKPILFFQVKERHALLMSGTRVILGDGYHRLLRASWDRRATLPAATLSARQLSKYVVD